MSNFKDESEKQTKRINFRLTQLEYAKLKFSASTYDLTVSNYTKKLALKSNLRQPYFHTSKTKEIILELSRQGNNLNQIAHRLNQDDPLTPEILMVLKQAKKVDEKQALQKKLNIQAMVTFLANCFICLLFFFFVIKILVYQGIWNDWGLHYLFEY